MRTKVYDEAGLKKYLRTQKQSGRKFVDMYLNMRCYEMARKFYLVEAKTYVVFTTKFGSIANISDGLLRDIHYAAARGKDRLFVSAIALTPEDIKTLRKNGVRFHPCVYRVYL